MPFEKDPDEIGALWNKTGKKGDYMTGTIHGEPVVVFKVKGGSERAPNWRVLKAQPKPEKPVAPAVDVDDIGF